MKFYHLFLTMFILIFLIISFVDEPISKANNNFDIYSNISNNARETNHISSFVWEDDFLDESKIDNLFSYNYEVDKNQGIVYMSNTFEGWHNSDFIRMKIIDIYNSDSETYTDYVIDMIIDYDTDMQMDFKDLRFTDIKGNSLYW